MKHLATLLIFAFALPAAIGQKRFETSLTFKIGNYTTLHRQPALVYFEDIPATTERTLPGYIGMVGVQERLRLSSRWSIAAEVLYGFAEYQRRDVFTSCAYCDCAGPCGDLVDIRYAVYQVLLPVHTGFLLSENGRWRLSLGAAFSYTFAASQASSSAWLGSTEPKQSSPTEPVDFNRYRPFYNPRWQPLLHGGISCRISEHTHIGLETFWNPRGHISDSNHGWSQTAQPPGVMKNVSVAVRNVLGSKK